MKKISKYLVIPLQIIGYVVEWTSVIVLGLGTILYAFSIALKSPLDIPEVIKAYKEKIKAQKEGEKPQEV